MKAYKYRIYPTKEQEVYFAKTFGCVRKVYNLMLNERIKNYELEKEKGIKSKLPTPAKYKAEYAFLKEVDSLSLANAQMHLNKAYHHFFRGIKNKQQKIGFPKFKSKHNPVQSYTTNNQKGSVCIIEDTRLKLPKLKTAVKIRLHRFFSGMIKSVTISRTHTGKYFASLLIMESKKPISKLPIEEKNVLGIDLGITHYLSDSLGNKYENYNYLKSSLEHLKRTQRQLSRKQKGSKNREKQKRIVSKIHEKISNKRSDFLHKLTHKLAYDSQVSCFVIEDLHIKGMMRNRRLSRAISDCGWSKFIEYLSYKCVDLGKSVVKIDRFFASSKTCSCCGHKMEEMPLRIRSWGCPSCDTHHDRDINAAKNIKAYALAHILGTRKCVKRSPVTLPLGDGVTAKGIDNVRYGSHEAPPIAKA